MKVCLVTSRERVYINIISSKHMCMNIVSGMRLWPVTIKSTHFRSYLRFTQLSIVLFLLKTKSR